MEDDDFDGPWADVADPSPDPLEDAGWTAGDFTNGQGLFGMRPIEADDGADGTNGPAPPWQGPVQVDPPPQVTPMPSQAPPDLTQQAPGFTPQMPASGACPGKPKAPGHGSGRHSQAAPQPMRFDPDTASDPMHMAGPKGRIGSGHAPNILPITGKAPFLATGLNGGHGLPWPTPPWLTKGRPL